MSEFGDLIDKLSNLKLELTPSTDSASQSEEVISHINKILSEVKGENSTAGTYNISDIQNTLSLPEILANNQNNCLSDSSISEIKMAQQFKPEYLSCIPQFDGNPNDLNRYLAVCQSVVDTFYVANEPNNFQNIYLLNCIIGKLTGNAKLILGTQNVQTWDELKTTLSRHFADQRDEACLNRDLVLLRQQNAEKPSQFYERILHILNLLCSYVNIHEANDAAKALKRSLYNDLALKTFLSGLKEPLGTTIRCMRPRDLPEALQFVTQEYNTQYFQNLSKIPNQKQPNEYFRPAINQNYPRPQSTFNIHTPHNFFNNRPSFPSQPIAIRPNYNKMQQRYPTNSQVFKSQRPNQQTNVFKPNPNKQFPPPTPMSTSTRQTNNNFRGNTGQQPHFKNHFQSRPNQQPNFVVEELYNTNSYDTDTLGPEYSEGLEQDPYFYDKDNQYETQNLDQESQYYDEVDAGQNIEPTQQNIPSVSSDNNQNFYGVPPEHPDT